MPAFALILCAVAAVLGTLALTPSSPDLRLVVDGALGALAAGTAAGKLGPPQLTLLAGAFLVAGGLNAQLRRDAAPLLTEHRTARYAGTLRERVASGDGSTALTIALDNGLHVVAYVRQAAPPAGSRIIVRGRLVPFNEARNPGEPSERAIEAEHGLDGRVDAADVVATGGASPANAQTWLAAAHEWAHAQLRDRLGEPAASVVAGELWGERAALPPALRTEFQETGTVHVLVTAGLHLGVVAALALTLLAPLALPRWLASLVAVVIVWVFVLWSGAQLPAERAATMATVAVAARALGRATLSWNALAIAALVVTFVRPQGVATASFALSFSCVGAIFACAGPVERWIEARVTLPARVREALVLSVATQLGVWPLGAAVFLQFTPYAVPANFAVVPCVAVTMMLGAAQLAFAWCAPLAQAFANCNAWLLAWMLAVVETVSAFPSAAAAMTPAPAWCIAAYDAALLAAPMLWRREARTLAVASLALATVCVLWPPRHIDDRLRVTVLDVGQADCIVVQTPRGHALLVDAGGRLERNLQGNASVAEQVGERVVVPFLLRAGIHAVDAIVISHPHGDHVGGAAPVLRRLGVTELADSGQRYGGHAYQDTIATAQSDRVPIVYPRAGMIWRTDDGVTLRFLGPSLPFIANSRNDINENSIAFLLRYGSFCMLFTGDAGASAEQRFLAQRVDLRCDVLKVGHHGSAYSSTPAFIAAVHPRLAIISVGRHNLFGHPAASTLETLRRYGAMVYRTDEDGAVTLVTDGKNEWVSSMLRWTESGLEADEVQRPAGRRLEPVLEAYGARRCCRGIARGREAGLMGRTHREETLRARIDERADRNRGGRGLGGSCCGQVGRVPQAVRCGASGLNPDGRMREVCGRKSPSPPLVQRGLRVRLRLRERTRPHVQLEWLKTIAFDRTRRRCINLNHRRRPVNDRRRGEGRGRLHAGQCNRGEDDIADHCEG
jgi:competence protein ComEC